MGRIIVEEYKSADFEDIEYFSTADTERIIQNFFCMYFKDKVFKKILILRTKFLKNSKQFFPDKIKNVRGIFSLSEAQSLRDQIYKACVSHGHLSVIFVFNDDNMIKEFLKLNYFHKVQDFNLLDKWKQVFPRKDEMLEFNRLIDKHLINSSTWLVVFSHDADFMYVMREEKS